ncbi:hypothetical protein C8039_12635 [Halogeometricum sp. wsp3]|nr:hypothetical protein C8039_12635 [Halogeometricum sp. wsp3]
MDPDHAVSNVRLSPMTGTAVIAVADAKWKTGGDSSGDVYQLTSYMLAEGVPGLLVYPQQDATERECRFRQ